MEVVTLLAWLGVAAAQFSSDLNSFEAFFERKRFGMKKKFRPVYHITTPLGWLNDPAGFAYYRDYYHIFYQYHPYNGAWGHVHWGHVISDNLVDWYHYPTALTPKEYYEKHGCLAGSAIVHNEYLTLFYTGSVLASNRTLQNQNLAISSDGVVFQKYLYNPIIKESPFLSPSSGEFRNPKVWKFRNTWYMIVGVMSNQHGQLMLYTSEDMFHWNLNGTIAQSYGDMGYVWESPDLFKLQDHHVLILSVRGVQTDGYRFRNLYQTGYVLSDFNYKTARFDEIEVSTATFNEVDHGHDFYASHTMEAPDGRRLLIAWLGMWESSMEELKDGWAGMLTLVRELKLTPQGRLLMNPVKELLNLRSEILEDAWYNPGEAFLAGSKAFELIVNSTIGANHAVLTLEWSGGDQQYTMSYFAAKGYMSVDRGGTDGIRRADWSPPEDRVSWRIFFDHSSVELFCGGGELVFSSRIYPRRPIKLRVGGDTQLHIVQYKIRRSVGFDKRIDLQLRDHIIERREKSNAKPMI